MAADISRWIGTLLTGEMEEPSKQCGKFCWRWTALVKQGKKIKELCLGPGPDEGLRAGQSSCGVGLGNALGRYCESCAGILSTKGECSSKDVRRNRSRPSRLSCQGPSGVVCFCALYCRMH